MMKNKYLFLVAFCVLSACTKQAAVRKETGSENKYAESNSNRTAAKWKQVKIKGKIRFF